MKVNILRSIKKRNMIDTGVSGKCPINLNFSQLENDSSIVYCDENEALFLRMMLFEVFHPP